MAKSTFTIVEVWSMFLDCWWIKVYCFDTTFLTFLAKVLFLVCQERALGKGALTQKAANGQRRLRAVAWRGDGVEQK